MKIVGVIKSFLPINAFEEPIYSDKNNKLYLHSLSGSSIELFSKVSLGKDEIIANLFWQSPEKEFQEGDSPYICFVLKGEKVFVGTREDLSKTLIPLLNDSSLPDFSKVTIASFYNLHNKTKKLIHKINSIPESEQNFHLLDEADFIESNLAKVSYPNNLEKDFQICESLIAKSDVLTWDDIFLLTSENIHFMNWVHKIESFLALSPARYQNQLAGIVIDHFESNPLLITNSFLRNNDKICNILLNSRNHVTTMAFHVIKYHEMEESLFSTKENKPEPIVSVDEKRKLHIQAKEIKEKMKLELTI